MRQAGRNAQLAFFGVSLHLQTKKRLIAAATDSSRVKKQSAPKGTSVSRIPSSTCQPWILPLPSLLT